MQAFKKIEAYGFKSFADKVVVDFMGGITCIVGPNGCGKSNVSDSIRWVLGEQSSRALRGTQMQDVIFKGTEERKPMGYCEVSLFFDNTKKIFQSDYSEVVLTRKLFKSGESEYLINGQCARLKDITGLLHDSGIDRDGLTIISQGQVAEIITSRPETRRGIFEEAAGIAKFKHTKVEAERKLEKTETDLQRVRDVIAEIEKNLSPLLRQAENAVKYMALRDELKSLEINLYVTQYDNASAAKSALTREMEIIDANIKSKQEFIAMGNDEISALNSQIDAYDTEIDSLRNQILTLSVGIEREHSDKKFESFEKINLLKQERAALISKKRTIENLIESGEGYKFSVRKVMESGSKDVVGVVAQELQVPQELETAIEVALGASAQNIITHNEDGAKNLIEYLRTKNLGRATFLPISGAKGRLLNSDEFKKIESKSYVLGVASQLVGFDEKIRPVVEALLGRTVIVDNLDNAIKLTRELNYGLKLVTLDGDVLEPRGSITGGSKSALNNNLWHTNTLSQINAELEALDIRLNRLQSQIETENAPGNQKIASLEKLDAVRSLIDEITKRKDAVRDEIARIETAKLSTSEEIANLTHQYYKTEASHARIDVTIEQMQIRVEEEYGMNYSASYMFLSENNIKTFTNAELENATARITTLKRQISMLGPVNMDAIEQSKSARERFTDYSTQVADLERAKADLEKVITDLSNEMVNKFKTSFDAINENFATVFRELFGGGKAKLELVPVVIDGKEKIDYLQSGIEIIAEPPGKKLSNLTLLSGGEKALTAIAILFAILKLKPMPFCLLDEIEAALDDANVARFANYLQKFAKDTQFIVITHRKPTMELANNLYGITMEEKGVSKVVSVKLENWTTDDSVDVESKTVSI